MEEATHVGATFLEKFRWSLPWLARYPFWRMREWVGRGASSEGGTQHVILIVANHFEPGSGAEGLRRVKEWSKLARATGNAIRDHDGTPFRHTNFFPAEQYERYLLDELCELQSDGYGEVEIHLHHGVGKPDTAGNTTRMLEDFRDVLAGEHRCLSRSRPDSIPMYAFVHGNWALANSAGNRFCGVDSEMQILADTGCYADFTLPSVPFQSQVPRINAIYQCGNPLSEAKPHRSGPGLRIGDKPTLPIIFTGPLVFDWTRRKFGLPVPRLEDGALAANYPLSPNRFNNWCGARVGVLGRSDWVFVKLYAHGFFDWDQDTMIGEELKRFMNEVLDLSERTGQLKIHFASARESFNMVMAAVDGHVGNPNDYRNYSLRQIMDELKSSANVSEDKLSDPVLTSS